MKQPTKLTTSQEMRNFSTKVALIIDAVGLVCLGAAYFFIMK